MSKDYTKMSNTDLYAEYEFQYNDYMRSKAELIQQLNNKTQEYLKLLDTMSDRQLIDKNKILDTIKDKQEEIKNKIDNHSKIN